MPISKHVVWFGKSHGQDIISPQITPFACVPQLQAAIGKVPWQTHGAVRLGGQNGAMSLRENKLKGNGFQAIKAIRSSGLLASRSATTSCCTCAPMVLAATAFAACWSKNNPRKATPCSRCAYTSYSGDLRRGRR